MDEVTNLTLANLTGPVPMGTNLAESGEGATVKTWAPAAREVRLRWDYSKDATGVWHHRKEARLHRLDGGMWGGFVPELTNGDRYMFYVVGPEGGSEGVKRDPYARDLTDEPGWPDCQCLVCR